MPSHYYVQMIRKTSIDLICRLMRVINVNVKQSNERINIMTKTNKEQLIENIKQATPERVKEHLLELIQDLVEEEQITPGADNGYIDNEEGIPLLDFYISNFMFTNFSE